MLRKQKRQRGTTLIALVAVVAALTIAPAAGATPVGSGFGFVPDASWAEGA